MRACEQMHACICAWQASTHACADASQFLSHTRTHTHFLSLARLQINVKCLLFKAKVVVVVVVVVCDKRENK